jgi:hypothetical protein
MPKEGWMLRRLGWAFVVVMPVFAAAPHFAISNAIGAAQAAETPVPPPPLSYSHWLRLRNDPAAWREFQSRLRPASRQPGTGPLASSPWQPLTNSPPFNPGAMLLLTDGTVMVQDDGSQASGSAGWWRLTPDINGSYLNGIWSQLASLPSGYAPLYYASAVLPDGRVIIEGGEYNNGAAVWTTLGAIYDPLANSWTSVSPPSGWTNIGDATATVLADGTFMLASCCSKQNALLNLGILTWTATGSGKYDANSEENWALLPDGSVLVVDAYYGTGTCGTGSERYTPSSGSWTSAGSTISQLADCNSNSYFGGPSYEMGPQVLRPDGTVVAFGATTNQVAHTAIFNAYSNSWAAGPVLPTINGQNYDMADAPAALLPSGNILFAASPGLYQTPTHFFEFNFSDNSITQVADPTYASSMSSYYGYMLVLPTGQILLNSRAGDIELYTGAGSPASGWVPTIANVPSTLVPGASYQISGQQFNGLSQGAAYGDDYQSATNYPIARITNNATGHVFFARTYGFNSMSVAPNTASTSNFSVPSSIETGASSLVVIANGIASQPASVTVSTGTTYTLSVTKSGVGSGIVTSSPSGINCGSTCSAQFSPETSVTLTATADGGSTFTGWSGGGCTGTGTCTVTMNSNISVSASFSTATSTLSVSVIGSPGGKVTSSPAGIDCGSTCSANFNNGTQVTLTATPAAAWGLAGWGGACGGIAGCSVTLNANASVSAAFTTLFSTVETPMVTSPSDVPALPPPIIGP